MAPQKSWFFCILLMFSPICIYSQHVALTIAGSPIEISIHIKPEPISGPLGSTELVADPASGRMKMKIVPVSPDPGYKYVLLAFLESPETEIETTIELLLPDASSENIYLPYKPYVDQFGNPQWVQSTSPKTPVFIRNGSYKEGLKWLWIVKESDIKNGIIRFQDKEFYLANYDTSKKTGLKEEGEKFLEKNKKKNNVLTTASGLQYEIIRQSNGQKPEVNSRVKVHYHCSLINGNVVDSSVDRGTPAVFGVTQVIEGMREALQLMPVGSKWKLFIPYQLAYGEKGVGNINIPPYSTLIFELELLEITKN